MKNVLLMILAAAAVLAENTFASTPCPLGCQVPEIDGGAALLAIGLTASVVALIRERVKKK